jgi:hypothetical protein
MILRTLAAFLAAAIAAGCAGAVPPGAAAPVEVIYAGAQCGSQDTEERATYIADAATLARSYAATRRFILNGDTPPPAVDFSREAALLVSMGTKPTAGFGLSLTDKPARIFGNTLEVILDWQSPPRGSAVAQVLTSPCLILKIPRDGYNEIRVFNRAGRTRARLNRP